MANNDNKETVKDQSMTAQEQERASYLEALEGVKSVLLNRRREAVFCILSNWTDSRSQVLFSVDRRRPLATFGKGKTPKLEELPTSALRSIAIALHYGVLIDATGKEASAIDGVDYRPLSGRGRVEKGQDPILASGYDAEDLNGALKPPESSETSDPEGAVIDRIAKRYYENGEYKALVAIQYLEQCNRGRQRILTQLEDWIHDLEEKSKK